MKKILSLTALLITFSSIGYSQCPAITCPGNITVNNDPGNCSAVVNYTPPVGTDPCSTGGTSTFNFTGSVQSFTVPAGVTSVTMQLFGAQGASNTGGIVGGRGGSATGTIAVTPGDILNIYVSNTTIRTSIRQEFFSFFQLVCHNC